MTDGIRRTSLPVNTGINEVETTNKEVSTEANKPALQYQKIQDSFEKANPVLYQNTNTPPSEIPARVDADTANLLNQQLLSARLGPSTIRKQDSTFGSPVTDRLPNQSSDDLRSNFSNLPEIKEAINETKEALVKLKQYQEKVAEVKEQLDEFMGQDNTRSNATPIPQQPKTSELFESQNFKPITDNAVPIPQKDPGKISERSEIMPKIILKQDAAATETQIKQCEQQIKQCKEDIKSLESQIKELDEDLAKAEQEYAQNPTPALAKEIQAMKHQKAEIRDKIDQKHEEIKDLEDQIVKIKTGKDPQENTAEPPREATNL